MNRNTPRIKTNDYLIQKALRKVTTVNHQFDTVEKYLEFCDNNIVELPIDLPFPLSQLIVVREKVPVVHSIFNPKPSSFLLDLLGDAPGSPFLLTDPGYQSVDSLFIATQTELEDSLYQEWMSYTKSAKVIVNSHPKYGILFGAALTSFYHV